MSILKFRRFLQIAVFLNVLRCTNSDEVCQIYRTENGQNFENCTSFFVPTYLTIKVPTSIRITIASIDTTGDFDFQIVNILSNKNNYTVRVFEIVMENLQIFKLSSKSFAGLNYMKKILLSKNNLSTIEEGTFSSLPSLEYLDLSMNALQNISRFSFIHSTENFNPTLVNASSTLKLLNLSHNVLKSFDISSISGAKQLSLDLSFNNITNFEIERALDTIGSLNLSYNALTEITDCFSNIKIINLSHNKIKTISNDLNGYCSLRNDVCVYLNLGYNFLSELKQNTFYNMSKLESLYLDHNDLTFLPSKIFSKLYSLKILGISQNNLKAFQQGLFEHIENLQILDVSHNELTDIGPYVYPLGKLEDLRLDNNLITILDSPQLLSDLPNLRNISINHNKFSCKQLVDIFRSLKKRLIFVPYGETKTVNNVHGIECEASQFSSKQENFSATLKEVEGNILQEISQCEDSLAKQNKVLTKFFNNCFCNNFNESEITNYFDKDFKNSTFFKYLEKLTENEIGTVDLNKSFYKFFNDDFKNSSYVKYFENLTKTDEVLSDNFVKSKMFNFFKRVFQDTNFYKYTVNLRTKNGNVNKQNNDSYFIIFLAFSSIQILMIGFLVVVAVKMYLISLRRGAVRHEQVELINK